MEANLSNNITQAKNKFIYVSLRTFLVANLSWWLSYTVVKRVKVHTPIKYFGSRLKRHMCPNCNGCLLNNNLLLEFWVLWNRPHVANHQINLKVFMPPRWPWLIRWHSRWTVSTCWGRARWRCWSPAPCSAAAARPESGPPCPGSWTGACRRRRSTWWRKVQTLLAEAEIYRGLLV